MMRILRWVGFVGLAFYPAGWVWASNLMHDTRFALPLLILGVVAWMVAAVPTLLSVIQTSRTPPAGEIVEIAVLTVLSAAMLCFDLMLLRLGLMFKP